MKAFFEKIIWENEAKTIATFYFWPERNYEYIAGQYADFTIPHEPHDTRGQVRTMTLSSSPDESLISFTTRVNPASSSFKRALLALRPEQEITVFDAMGDLVLPLDKSIPLVFIAGGLGVASFIGMVKWLENRQETRSIRILYAVKRASDMIFLKDYVRYAQKHSLQIDIFTSDQACTSSEAYSVTLGRLKGHDIVQDIAPNALVYISGTETMVEQVRQDLLKKHNFPANQIIFDYYDGYSGNI